MRHVNTFLSGNATRYRVINAVVVCNLIGGGEKYIYKDGWLPLDASPAQVEHLISLNVIEKVVA